MLQRAIDQGTGASLRSRYGVTSAIAGKTGTSQDYGDAWFVAYTPGLVIGTWVGAFDNDVHFRSPLGTGGQLALPIAGKVIRGMEQAPELRKRYIRPFLVDPEYEADLTCDARPSALEELIQDVFGPKGGKPAKVDSVKKETIFDKLFKKKE